METERRGWEKEDRRGRWSGVEGLRDGLYLHLQQLSAVGPDSHTPGIVRNVRRLAGVPDARDRALAVVQTLSRARRWV